MRSSTPRPDLLQGARCSLPGAVHSANLPSTPGHGPTPFHAKDPWGEKAHTYLRAQGFGAAGDADPGRWSRQHQWTVAELGVGTGCSLACLLAAFGRHGAPSQRLHYIGFELDPSMLDWWREPASRTAVPPPERAALEALLERAVPTRQGITRWRMFDGRATITLVMGDALAWLPHLSFAADAWFLDAYEPAVEMRLWTPECLAHIARLTKPGGTASTFSAAAAVRQGLDAAGFTVQRVDGFETKRHMSLALRREHEPGCTIEPWFVPPRPSMPGSVSIVGAGLAGAWCARAFAERGVRVTVVDRSPNPPRASDVPLAAAAQPDGSWQSETVRVHDAAWRVLVARCLELALPHRLLSVSTASGPTDRMAIVASPRDLIQRLLDHPMIALTDRAPGDAFVVHATGLATQALDGTVCMSARPRPNGGSIGQVLLDAAPTAAIMDQGYALPCADGVHAWIGATNHQASRESGASTPPLRGNDPHHDAPALEAIGATLLGSAHRVVSLWSGTRASSLDHLPIVGPVASHDDFTDAYRAIRHGAAARAWPVCSYAAGQWCSIGHGSHGMLTAPLAAELIADLAFGTPRCIADELLPHLLPQRFALRELRRARS